MAWVLSTALLWGIPGHATSVRRLVGENTQARNVLKSDFIHVQLTGSMELDFGQALKVFLSDDGLIQIQRAYAELLPPGEKPEFEIKRDKGSHYCYVNRKDQRSDIHELCRRQTGEHRMEVVYYMTSTRFFGDFEALIHVEISRSENRAAAYRLNVYALPERPTFRFLARHLKLVDRFFRSKSDSMVDLSTRVFQHLCRERTTNPHAADGHGPRTKHAPVCRLPTLTNTETEDRQ